MGRMGLGQPDGILPKNIVMNLFGLSNGWNKCRMPSVGSHEPCGFGAVYALIELHL